MGVGEVGSDLELTLRPRVPMGHFTGIPFVCALATAEALGGRVSWPYEVIDGQGLPLARVRTRAGYDDEGMYAVFGLLLEEAALAADGVGELVEGSVRARVEAWEADVAAGRAAAGPLAPVLEGYFGALAGMGERVEVVRAGRTIARGTLAGVDVWGRATVLADDGTELEVAPEQAVLVPER